ncbi:MAG: glycosyl hydrolase family 28-related protein, partial [Verrucomicrobiales bacterium]|nr:glycosyl hydrolase family 28-related protein [Verrucomicrobiales bacterium]
VGDGVADDTAAIRKAFAAESEIHFPAGVYLITDGIELPRSATITGEGSPTLGTFPLNDDKTHLDENRFEGLPGTTLVFRGSGKKSLETTRADQFSSMRYALKTATDSPWQISNLAILLDMQVSDEGKKHSSKSDKRSDFDIGFLVDDSPGGSMHHVSVYGYWQKAGLCIVTRAEGGNPDYNTFWNSSFSGDYGVALIGNDKKDGPGLSGTQFFGCNLFSNDHHLRSSGQWGRGSLYIDGKTSGARADLNGHYFFGGCVRTYNNVAVRLNHASNVSFHGTIFEVPGWDGKNEKGGDTTGKIVGTANTRDVMFFGCRMHDIGLHKLAETMTDGSVTVAGDASEGIFIQTGSKLARLFANAGGDPLLQLSDESRSINSGWTLRHDTSEGSELDIRFNNKPAANLREDGSLTVAQIRAGKWQLHRGKTEIIVNATIPVSQARMKVKATKSGDRLTTLAGGSEGDLLLLERIASSEVFTVESTGSGNIKLPSLFVFDHFYDRLTLIHSNGEWIETARTDFEAAE